MTAPRIAGRAKVVTAPSRGAMAFAGDAILHGGFHFFAFPMVVAGTIVVVTVREGGARRRTAS